MTYINNNKIKKTFNKYYYYYYAFSQKTLFLVCNCNYHNADLIFYCFFQILLSFQLMNLQIKEKKVLEAVILIAFLLVFTHCGTCLSSTIDGCAAIDSSNTFGVSNVSNCGCLACSYTHIRFGMYSCSPCSSTFVNCLVCNSSTCGYCHPGFSFDASHTCITCAPIMAWCMACVFAPSACVACYPTFFFNINHICQPCLNYLAICKYCTSETTCTECLTANYGVNTTDKCVPCFTGIKNCSTCTNTTICLTCDTGYKMLDSNTLCAICSELMANCSECNSSTSCQTCNQLTYGVNDTAIPDQCILCDTVAPACLQCTLYTYCTLCKNISYTLQYISPSIENCVTCEYFMLGCSTCSSNTTCLSCIPNQQFLLNLGTHACDPCYSFIPFCLTCTPSHICLSCFGPYAISSNGSCLPCIDFMLFCHLCSSNKTCDRCLGGKLVSDQSGCSHIVGCISVNPLASISNNCKACEPFNFQPLPQFGRCVCIQGWIVGSYCTTVIGCTALIMVNNKSQCVSCDVTKKFMLKDVTCVCVKHYYFNGTGCEQICGDGYVVSDACDDGNLINGDGCSDNCQVEQDYVCSNENSRNPSSICPFRARVELFLVSIQKNILPNTAQITFNIQPFNNKISKMDISSAVSFIAHGCTAKTIRIVGTKLVISFQYNKNVDNQNAIINLKFESQYVQSPKFRSNFQIIQSDGLSLSVGEQLQLNKSYGIIMFALSFLSLCVFAIGSVAFKMIGVQTLYTLQISWCLLTTSKYYKTFFINFKNLNYSYGQFSLTNEGEKLSNRFGNLGFTSNNTDNYVLYTIINVLIVAVYSITLAYQFVLKVRIQKTQNQNDTKLNLNGRQTRAHQLTMDRLNIFLRIFYNWILFPIFIGFFLHFLHTLQAKQFSNDSKQTQFYYLLSFILTFITTSLIFHSQMLNSKKLPQNNILKKSEKSMYIPYFLLHNFLLFFFVSIAIIKNKQLYSYYMGIALVVSHTSYLIVKRPYESGLSNFSIIFNQFAILFSIFWVLSKGTSIDSNQTSLLFINAFIGIFYSVNALGIIRSLVALKEAYSNRTNHRKPDDLQQKRRKVSEIIEQKSPRQLKFDIENIVIHPPRQNRNRISLQSPFLNNNKLPLNELLSGSNRLFQASYIRERN